MINFLFTKTPLLFFVQSLWRDEAFSYLLARKSIVDIFVLTAKDFNPPLYYILLHYWMKIFGSSEISLRSLSFCAFWIMIYVAYLFLKEVMKFETKKCFYYLVLIIINPLLLYYAFEARMYALFALFAMLSFYSFYVKNKWLYILSTVLGLYTHYFMIFVLITQTLFVLLTSPRKQRIKISYSYFLLPVLLFLPWMIFLTTVQHSISESFWIQRITLISFLTLLGSLYTGYERDLKFFSQQIGLLSTELFFLILAAFVMWKRKTSFEQSLFKYVFLWTFVTPAIVLIISLIKPVFLPRYIIFSTLGFLFLFIFLIDKMQKKLRIILFILLMVSAGIYHIPQTMFRTKTNLSRTIREIMYVKKTQDLVYVASELDFFVAKYYLDKQNVYIYGKTYEEIPSYVGKVLISKDDIKNQLPYFPRRAFILKSDGSYNIQAAL